MFSRTIIVITVLISGATALSGTGDSRRAFISKVAATSAAVAGGILSPTPALAVGGLKKVDALLTR